MAWMIGLLMAVQMALDIMKVEVSLAPGLSLKNILLYLIAGFIAIRIALRQDARFELRGVQVSYIALIFYAAVTWLVASVVIQYQGYPMLENAMSLKGGLADYFLFFLVCFYGLRTESDAMKVLKSVLLTISAGNLLTLTDSSGLTDFGLIEVRADGRVQGALGESNQYAAFLAFYIPILTAMLVSARGWARILWGVCTVMAMLCMMVTVSRGGFAGLGLSIATGLWMFRRQLPVGKLIGLGLLSLVGLLIMLFIVDSNFRALVMERFVQGEMKADPGGITSGRTDTWTTAVVTMLENPITLLTGYGWRVYFSMPFEGAPHNTYLNFWFNLGIPGVICFCVMNYTLIATSARLAMRITGDMSYLFMGFAIGMLGACIAVFFVELYQPWIYLWATSGIVMRLAMLKKEEFAELRKRENSDRSGSISAPRFGWSAKTSVVRSSATRRRAS